MMARGSAPGHFFTAALSVLKERSVFLLFQNGNVMFQMELDFSMQTGNEVKP
ncbi:hypothetical protein Cabys_2904 [Caldithrix abyssi DSM 13497]|uniref:Uncharacterized protein n=1 Tax=Caldithrix abyssi DSM 13497 TaxID=880073 RepID=A0A1J1CB76_CALAY|nr:hypothetical protein Cabys_2904 [Caldithrix abyssi DSM 13497]